MCVCVHVHVVRVCVCTCTCMWCVCAGCHNIYSFQQSVQFLAHIQIIANSILYDEHMVGNKNLFMYVMLFVVEEQFKPTNTDIKIQTHVHVYFLFKLILSLENI